MPKTKLQNVIFTIIMAFVMVYAMVCYNIAIDKGGMSNQIFLLAFHEMPIMWPIAAILEFFVVEKLSKFLAFRIVCLMCPVMSFIATALFKHPGSEIIAQWLQTTVINFPMALCWQIFFAGPLVRNVFGKFVK